MDIATVGGMPDHSPDQSPVTADAARAAGAGKLSTRFGAIPLDPTRQIRFRGGLPGFPQAEWFQLASIPGIDADLVILQAVEVPDIGFIAMPLPLDTPVIHESDLRHATRLLGIAMGELSVFAIVSLVETPAGIEKFVNLRAPLFVDQRRGLGAQVVLADPAYPLRHRLTPFQGG